MNKNKCLKCKHQIEFVCYTTTERCKSCKCLGCRYRPNNLYCCLKDLKIKSNFEFEPRNRMFNKFHVCKGDKVVLVTKNYGKVYGTVLSVNNDEIEVIGKGGVYNLKYEEVLMVEREGAS